MERKCLKRYCLLFLIAFGTVNAQAQLKEAVKNILLRDTVETSNVSLKKDSDSTQLANLQKSLVEARLSEANLRMEMEQMKLQMATADSVKFARQRLRIDSLRKFTKGIPVVADGDTLFISIQSVEAIPLSNGHK